LKPRTVNLLLTLAGVWLVAMATLVPKFAALRQQTTELSNTFQEFGDLLTKGEFASAYEYCSGDFRRATSLADFEATQRALEAKNGRLLTVNNDGQHVKGEGSPIAWVGSVEAKFRYENGNITMDCIFHKENNKWRIFGMRQK
jgi:hypothetical protein